MQPAARRSHRGEEDLSWCFYERSENSRLVKAFNFAETDIGPIEGWPMALKVALSICLSSRFPMILWLGRSLHLIYNDAYNPWLGPRHPRALGHPGQECWGEIWDIIGAALRSVLDTGVATWSEDKLLLVSRYGEIEESYWTYSYSPIRDESNAVVGVFTAVEETTGRVVGERRLRTLQELSSRTASAPTSAAVAEACSEACSHNAYDVPLMALYLLETDLSLAAAVGFCADTGLPRTVSVASQAVATPNDIFSVPLRSVVSLQGFSRIEVAVPLDYPLQLTRADIDRPKKAIILPLLSITPNEQANGAHKSSVLGAIVIGINARKPVDDLYNTFLSLLASSMTAALVTARDYEREKKRAEELVELNQAKTTFFHNISHEFRTPLTLMLGPLEEVLERALTLPEEHRESLERVLRNGNRLLKLVNVLLDFSRIEAGRMRATFRPVDLAAFTAELCSLFRSACERARLEFIVDTPTLHDAVYVDSDMWEQIVVNLVGNAFKYTLRGSIKAHLYEQGNTVVFSVTDTGCGIAADHLGRVFERFYRIHGSQGRSDEGSGIGLALLAELVKLHSGEVFVESELGKGSRFRVVLQKGRAHLPDDQVREEPVTMKPINKKGMLDWWIQLTPNETPRTHGAKRAKRANSPKLSPQQASARVLVADDNADMLAYVSRIVKDAGYEVATAPNGEVALEILCTSSPPIDLLVSVRI